MTGSDLQSSGGDEPSHVAGAGEVGDIAEGQTLADPSHHRSTREQVVAAALFAVTTVAVAAIGSIATSSGQDWYDGLDRPFLTPPDGTFSIVWTVLYVMVATAGWLAWRATDSRVPTVAWAVQMALNLGWSSVFFGLESIGGGMVVVTALFVAAGIATLVAGRSSALAGLLFAPYLAWIAFAFVLNAGFAAENFR